MLPCEFVSIISITAIDYKFIPAQPPAGHRLLSHTAVSVYLAYVWHSGAMQQCNNATMRLFLKLHVRAGVSFNKLLHCCIDALSILKRIFTFFAYDSLLYNSQCELFAIIAHNALYNIDTRR